MEAQNTYRASSLPEAVVVLDLRCLAICYPLGLDSILLYYKTIPGETHKFCTHARRHILLRCGKVDMGRMAVRLERRCGRRPSQGGEQPLAVCGFNLFGYAWRDVLEPRPRGTRASIRACGDLNRYATTGGLKPPLVGLVLEPYGAATMTGLSSAPGLVGTAC